MKRLRRPLQASVKRRRNAAVRWGNSPAVAGMIDKMVQRIVRQFHPDKIILFGSQARGSTNENSDVDLLVVMPVEGSAFEKSVEIGCALRSISFPKDIIVVTPEKYEKRKDIIGTLAYEAEQEGKMLYARPA